MSGNSIGKAFVVTCFGESHGKLIGVTIDGGPAGLEISLDEIQRELDKRKPGVNEYVTSRAEEDRAELVSGVFNGKTTGAPITITVCNRDVDSSPYEESRDTPRPGHADYPARIRYGGYEDYRGGGRFSGRVTIAYVAAGAVAKK
ncbi:MAG: chorismate synthase, partial [Candidatus Bathyarchaeia archaeon]